MTKINGFNGDFNKDNQGHPAKAGQPQKAANSLFGKDPFVDIDNKMSLFANTQFNQNLKPDGSGKDFGFFDNLRT